MNVARVVAKRSSCVRAQVGAVIVDPRNRIVATGYNGPPATLASEKHLGTPAVCEFDCPRAFGAQVSSYDNCIAIHAEANALLFCDRRDSEGGTIYTTHVPCGDCIKLVANSGLVRIVTLDDQRPNRTFADLHRLMQRCGIEVVRWAL